MSNMYNDPNEALRALLQWCHPEQGPGTRKDQTFSGALDAIEALGHSLSKAGPQMPDGQRVVTELVAEGYCNTNTETAYLVRQEKPKPKRTGPSRLGLCVLVAMGLAGPPSAPAIASAPITQHEASVRACIAGYMDRVKGVSIPNSDYVESQIRLVCEDNLQKQHEFFFGK